MPYKIVETIEKGHPKLTIVPSNWEKNRLLRWPPPKQANNKLTMDETSIPLTDWLTMKCKVKRTAIPTFTRAEEEINLMMNHSDTSEIDDNYGRNIERNVDNTDAYNALAEKLISLQNNAEQDLSAVPGPSSGVDPPIAIEEVYDYVNSDVNVITAAIPDELNNKIDQLLSNQKIILDNQKTLMNNQFYLHESQKTLIEQEKKHCRELSNLAVLTEDSFSRLIRNKSTVVKLLERDTIENQSFVIQPIANNKELEELEQKLEDKQHKHKMQQQYLLLCTTTTGSGVNCSYKLLDIIFKREFLTTCSWSGGSRGDTVKVPLKKYKNILSFFYEMINKWDPSYTREDNDKFFKTILKNAVKRLYIKDLRASTKRTRKDKVTSSGQKTKPKVVNIGVGNSDIEMNVQEFGNQRTSNDKLETENEDREEDKNNSDNEDQLNGEKIDNPMKRKPGESIKGQTMGNFTCNSYIENEFQDSDYDETTSEEHNFEDEDTEEDNNQAENTYQLTGEEIHKSGDSESSKTNTKIVLQVTKEKVKESQQEKLEYKVPKITTKNIHYKKSKNENNNADNQELKRNIEKPLKRKPEEEQTVKKKKSKLNTRDEKRVNLDI